MSGRLDMIHECMKQSNEVIEDVEKVVDIIRGKYSAKLFLEKVTKLNNEIRHLVDMANDIENHSIFGIKSACSRVDVIREELEMMLMMLEMATVNVIM